MSAAAELRELILKAMRQHAEIAPRGFDSIKAREHLHRQIDDMYDDYALECLTDEVSA